MPTDPAYAGIVLNTQCLCLEFGPSFNLTAITSTNGLALQIGALLLERRALLDDAQEMRDSGLAATPVREAS